jgi:hypothetical protein
MSEMIHRNGIFTHQRKLQICISAKKINFYPSKCELRNF